MTIEIGRLHSFWVGKEVTPGTAVAPTLWVPVENGNVKPIIETEKDESGFGTISAAADAHVTKQSSELTFKGNYRPQSFWFILLGTLGTAAAPVLVETGVYTHAFSVANNNSHPSFTFIHDNQTQEEQVTYCMIDTLSLSFAAWKYVKFDAKLKWQVQTDTTWNTPSFLSTKDDPMLVSKASIKFATDIAGLSGASRVWVINAKVTIEKNLEQIFSTMTSATEALAFTTQHNKDLRVKWDFEIVYDAKTYKDLVIAGTKKAIEIQVDWRNLIGATKYDGLTIQLASVILEDWGVSDDNNGIVTQTFGFTGLYKLAETKQITISIQNARSAQY